MENLMNNNTVYLTGVVAAEPVYSHQVFGEGFYESLIEVERLSEQKDLIPVTISDRLIDGGSFEVGSRIALTGQFRSYNKLIDGRSKLMLTVFVRELTADTDDNVNRIDINGFVCKAPVFRTTPFKREIADILIAVNRSYNKSDYLPCIAWGRNARFASGLSVGAKVNLSGRIQSREYQKILESGEIEIRVAYEISVNRIGFSEESEETD